MILSPHGLLNAIAYTTLRCPSSVSSSSPVVVFHTWCRCREKKSERVVVVVLNVFSRCITTALCSRGFVSAGRKGWGRITLEWIRFSRVRGCGSENSATSEGEEGRRAGIRTSSKKERRKREDEKDKTFGITRKTSRYGKGALLHRVPTSLAGDVVGLPSLA